MIPIEQRLDRPEFWAYPANDTIEPTFERIKTLVNTGRPMIYGERYLDAGQMRIFPGLKIQEGGIAPGMDCRRTRGDVYFHVHLMPGIHGIGAAARITDTEAQESERFHAKRNGTRIEVHGFGLGRDDHVRVLRWNEYGVGHESCLHFQYEDIDRDADMIEALGDLGDWSRADLHELAEQARYHGQAPLMLAQKRRGADDE